MNKKGMFWLIYLIIFFVLLYTFPKTMITIIIIGLIVLVALIYTESYSHKKKDYWK